MKIELIGRNSGSEVTSINKQRFGKFIFPCLRIECGSEEAAKWFANEVGNDPLRLAELIVEELKHSKGN